MAQLVARVLSMHEVAGSIPAVSTFLFLDFQMFCLVCSFFTFAQLLPLCNVW